MKIGFDLDGVLCHYVLSFNKLLIDLYGNRFPEGYDLATEPGDWNWFWQPGLYTREECFAAFKAVSDSPNFFYNLKPHEENTSTLAMCIESIEHHHDVYYVTHREGRTVKRQTESWLRAYLPYVDPAVNPTVVLAKDKGAAARALQLDAYIDDNFDNARSVLLANGLQTRMYLLNRRYNTYGGELSVRLYPDASLAPEGVVKSAIRVNTLGEMLTRELVAQ